MIGGLRAEVRETNTAVVLLMGDRAYKIKKPVDLGFLDFTTVESRRTACEAERELNSRLSPDVYLDVLAVTGTDGSVVDHVLAMRRMPDDRRLSTLIRDGVDTSDAVRAVARLLAAFHATAERNDVISEVAFDGLARRWHDNLAETVRFRDDLLPPGVHERIASLVRDYLDGRHALFAERAAKGMAVDGHADLIADDVFWLPDGPRVLDCLEFDSRLRYVDALDDAAFFAMDLEHLGHPELAEQFLRWYIEFSGSPTVPSLEHHYVAYRAYVRAKVACIRHDQGDPNGAADARRFALQALHHLDEAAVRFILVGGGPASGKSTLAGSLAVSLGAVLLRTDVIRRELAIPEEERYSAASKKAVYDELLSRARASLEHGETVIADATWGGLDDRRAAERIAQVTSSRLIALECHVPVEVAVERAAERSAFAGDESEAGPDVARRLSRREPWPEATTLDGTAAPAEITRRAVAAIRAVPGA